METQENHEAPSTMQPEELDEQISVVDAARGGEEEEQHEAKTSEQTGTKARYIIAGLAGAAILSIIAILVAGSFQLTSKWLLCKPNSLLSDPAQVHWSELISDKIATVSTGVPRALEDEVRFKGLLLSTKAQGQE